MPELVVRPQKIKVFGRPGGVQRSVMMGDMLIYEADSGILKAVMDAEYITTLRTGAVAAHSALRKERF